MNTQTKKDQILDALQLLLREKNLKTISISEIAQTAGIGKGSIYYYFPSKDAILEALITRNYEKPLETAKLLAKQKHLSIVTRAAIIFQACHGASLALGRYETDSATLHAPERSLLHQKYMRHLISELKPVLTDLFKQGIESGNIDFDNPAALAEIILIVLIVKLDNTLTPSAPEEIESTIRGLISLLEKGTKISSESLDYLTGLDIPNINDLDIS